MKATMKQIILDNYQNSNLFWFATDKQKYQRELEFIFCGS
jgi:hypothetical protein